MRFEVAVPEVDELDEGPPAEVAVENARRKAAAAAGSWAAPIVGVDTVVHLDGRIYGKAPDAAGARATLAALSGRRHEVVSGICVLDDDGSRTAAVTTVVEFRPLNDELIDWYVACGEWRERAGCYAIQGRGAAFVRRIEGDYLNVVGLPVVELFELLEPP